MGFASSAMYGLEAILNAVQNVSAGYNRAANYENQARAADANSRIAALNAGITESQGKIEDSQAAREGFKQLGRQRAAMAQGGVLESPTGLLVREESEARLRDDRFQLNLGSNLKKQGYDFQAADLRGAAQVARSNAKYAIYSGWMSGISSFAGGLGKSFSSIGALGTHA